MPSNPWPYHAPEEIHAVSEVLASGRTNYWTGTIGRQFEKEYAAQVGTRYAVALMNGTVALEAALYAVGVGPGDEVITSCRTFIASASCIVMRGATPVLADVDLTTQNITAESIAACITPRTKAIIVVHLAGWPAEMDPISKLAQKHQLKIIEDCAQAHGAVYRNKQVGNLGDVAAFSFCQDKIITTGGEGGMVTTNDESIWEKIWSFKDHGKSYAKTEHYKHPPGYRWLHDNFGTNLRMTEMQAAIGCLQLKKLPQWLQTRRKHAAILNARFGNIPYLRTTVPPQEIEHAYYKYYVFLRPEYLRPGWHRDRIVQEINTLGVACFVGSCSEIYLEQAFQRQTGLRLNAKPNAKLLGETSLMLLVHPTLTEQDMQDTADKVLQVLEEACVSDAVYSE
jgi:hypothetical protein